MDKMQRLLIVDDDPNNIFALKSVLLSRNFKVTTVQNGFEALRLLEQNEGNIQIVLMDMMMPVMDGYAATQAIRRLPQGDKLKVIALTAKVLQQDRQKCLDAGADDYCPKPVDIDYLMAIIKQYNY